MHLQKFEGFFQDFLHNEERVQNNYNLIVFCWLTNFNSAFANYKFFDLQDTFLMSKFNGALLLLKQKTKEVNISKYQPKLKFVFLHEV